MFKKLLFGDEARAKILKGINVVADAVCTTLGPRGTHVIFEESKYSRPTITKDWVTVAQQVFLEDQFENMGVLVARESAEKTNQTAGDGTTSTVAILQSIMNEGSKYVSAGMNPVLIKKGMDAATDLVIKQLNSLSREIKTQEDKLNIATISANNDQELGKLIVGVVDKIGGDGVVTVTTSNLLNTEVEYLSGTKLSSGYESSIFINDAKHLACELENPVIILTTDRISQQAQLIPILDKILKAGKHDMVLFAEDIEGQALAFLIQNFLQGKFRCVPVKFPSFSGYQKSVMLDIATMVKGQLLGEEQGKKIGDGLYEDCGTCENIVVYRDSTLITGGTWDITERINEVKTLMDGEKDTFRIDKLKERLSKLTGKAANIKVGGSSDTEQSEIKYRIEDALNATKSAIEEGIVEGAGTALVRAGNHVEVTDANSEFNAGVKIVLNAIQAPFKKIILNGGWNSDAILGKIIDSENSYNSLTMKYEDLFKSGIIDPTKVVKNELLNAVSTAGILLTSTVAIINVEDKKE